MDSKLDHPLYLFLPDIPLLANVKARRRLETKVVSAARRQRGPVGEMAAMEGAEVEDRLLLPGFWCFRLKTRFQALPELGNHSRRSGFSERILGSALLTY